MGVTTTSTTTSLTRSIRSNQNAVDELNASNKKKRLLSANKPTSTSVKHVPPNTSKRVGRPKRIVVSAANNIVTSKKKLMTRQSTNKTNGINKSYKEMSDTDSSSHKSNDTERVSVHSTRSYTSVHSDDFTSFKDVLISNITEVEQHHEATMSDVNDDRPNLTTLYGINGDNYWDGFMENSFPCGVRSEAERNERIVYQDAMNKRATQRVKNLTKKSLQNEENEKRQL